MARTLPELSRVLIFELDSMAQGARFRSLFTTLASSRHGCASDGELSLAEMAHREPDLVRTYIAEITAEIRTALLVCDRVVVTDSMLLDGLYFALVTPDELADELAVPVSKLPFDIVTAQNSLAEAARAKPRDFDWQLDRFMSASARRQHITRWSDTRLRLPMRSPVAFGTLAPFPSPDRERLSADGRRILSAIENETRRSAVTTQAHKARRRGDDDVRAVLAWWHDRYLSAIAAANGVEWLSFNPSPITARAGTGGLATRSLAVPPALLTHSRGMSPVAFGVTRYTTTPLRERVHERPTGVRIRDLSYGVVHALSTTRRVPLLVSAAVRLVVGIVAVLAAIPTLQLVVDAWHWQIDVAWVAFGVAILTTIPFGAVGTILGALSPSHQIVLGVTSTGARS